MRRPLALVVFLFSASAIGWAGAQPDRTAALEKARTRFEADITKAEEALVTSIDRALKSAQTAKDRQAVEKLTYEREQFVKQRLVPTTVPTAAYLKQRAQSIAAIEAAYAPVLKELVKAKKDEDVAALETALNDLVKTTRGYGLALPELEGRSVLIESKANGLVIETEHKDGTGSLVLGPKVGKKKPSQCWIIEREEKGCVIRNVASGHTFNVPTGTGAPGVGLVSWPLDRTKVPPPNTLFVITEIRREVVISIPFDGLTLTANEMKVKGVTTGTAIQEKKEEPLPAKQRWVFTEAK